NHAAANGVGARAMGIGGGALCAGRSFFPCRQLYLARRSRTQLPRTHPHLSTGAVALPAAHFPRASGASSLQTRVHPVAIRWTVCVQRRSPVVRQSVDLEGAQLCRLSGGLLGTRL